MKKKKTRQIADFPHVSAVSICALSACADMTMNGACVCV